MFFTEIKNILRRMDTEPSKLENKTLVDYHRKTHMLYSKSIKSKPLNRKLINNIVNLHDNYVKEMTKRNMNHKTPLRKI